MPEAHAQLLEILRLLERHYRDMQDVEFTIEEGTALPAADPQRQAPGPGSGAVRPSTRSRRVCSTWRGRLQTIDADSLEALLHPVFDPEFSYEALTRGVAASPGAAKGGIALSAARGDPPRASRTRSVILVRAFTEADDVAGFHAAKGILTAEGGKASHAALVARGMGRPCVAGASALAIDQAAGRSASARSS